MQRLVGQGLPDMELPNSSGGFVNPRHVHGRAVYFFYPYTGRPGVPNPRGWDDIAGAHGSTPQALAYAVHYQKFRSAEVAVCGVSLLSQEWIADFAQRNLLPYDLLSDVGAKFSRHLELPFFTIDDVDYLQRITLVANDGVITHVRFPVGEPETDATHILELLR